ncbi:Ribosomal protein S18 acetylase RimI [Saccharopolyspora kobensis]|uniref:Ribosomal protein S18 acetylase RimI n=1 Tax=Saccharopolyspora kobensis TaxID=146035 RepID=A0A1H6BL22_9PSEU|nr:GNAT family N-acetyltransferase [Saccharopolyspora kobensis]SEG61165.1 Ribosomal protein S18 acetylase RimI [Saccharopolyspora kobensis]SFE87239.1 Ribosomal protein S18 acetylase RimI [Saccharopolyspora kobensis]
MTTIRVARPEEYEAIGEISVRAYTEAGSLPTDVDYAPVLRDAADRAEKAELLVAVTGDKPVGTVTVVRPGTAYAEVSRPGELEFRMLAVAPEAMGNGVGRALVQAVIDRARQDALERVVLCVKDTSTTAQKLYRGLGFQRCPERDWKPVPDVSLLAFLLDL